jgi:hypothetical protein
LNAVEVRRLAALFNLSARSMREHLQRTLQTKIGLTASVDADVAARGVGLKLTLLREGYRIE